MKYLVLVVTGDCIEDLVFPMELEAESFYAFGWRPCGEVATFDSDSETGECYAIHAIIHDGDGPLPQ